MTRLSARLKLRELLGGPIQELADQDCEGDPTLDLGIRLLVMREGRSEDLLKALVAKASLEPLESVFLDEEEPS